MKTSRPPFRVVSALRAPVLLVIVLSLCFSQICLCEAGVLRREVFTEVPGLSVADLTNSAKFPDHPDLVDVVEISQIGRAHV